ncbi:MAG: nucleotidyl transferase AbiEii/AbiGii toxin family protein [Candidatus Omnitrophota bacterium]
MLTYESLIEQGKVRGMPGTKMRGILREYLQVLILKELYKTEKGKDFYFTGGTYLRLLHNLKRFSEDLDFNTANITEKEFENLLEKMKKELKRTGLECEVKFSHWKNVFVSKLIFSNIEREYNVISKHSKKAGIIIKLETNNPKWETKSETQVISGFGEIYPCICTDKGVLFADKIDAFNKKNRARDIYDIIFMLSNKYSIDLKMMKKLGIEKDPLEVILERIQTFSKKELKKQAETVRPFLFNESEADLVINAHQILPQLLERYKQK